MGGGADSLLVKVELMDDPCLWRWEICDATRDEIIADSWSRDWVAYESREAALRAGHARLGTYQPSARPRDL